MAFVFDSTPKSTTANSFVSVSDADDYFAAHLEQSTWTDLDTPTKQSALVQATSRLNMEWFMGLKTTLDQRLVWPRKVVVGRELGVHGFILDADTIPVYLQQATCEQALVYIKINAGTFMLEDEDVETMKSYKIGPLDIGVRPGLEGDRIRGKVANLLKAIGPNVWRRQIGQQLSL